MFNRKETVSELASVKPFYRSANRLTRLTALIQIGLLALLFQAPIHATEPIDVDPDPDHSTTVIVEASEEAVATATLPSGHYMLIVVDEDGNRETREVYKQ